jgi:hypothetical protein
MAETKVSFSIKLPPFLFLPNIKEQVDYASFCAADTLLRTIRKMKQVNDVFEHDSNH